MFIQIYFLIRSQSILVSEYHETCYFYFQNAAITIPLGWCRIPQLPVTFDHYYFGLLTAVALSSEREKLGEDVVEDFLRDEAARTLGLEYSVQPLHLRCAEPAKIVTTYIFISAMLCMAMDG